MASQLGENDRKLQVGVASGENDCKYPLFGYDCDGSIIRIKPAMVIAHSSQFSEDGVAQVDVIAKEVKQKIK